ncbi:MAG: Mur ligase family protein [Kiritimatiellia bacterium]
MTALVIGYGRSGQAAEALLRRQGFAVTVLDGDRPFPDGDFAVAVISPGIALTHAWAVEARRRAIPLKSELQLGCEELKRLGWRLLAVTGSKGKSSVVKVVAEAIALSGVRAVACGNYGLPVCAVALSASVRAGEPAPWAVVEVSSFMLETTELPSDTFAAAAILNLQADHLDRHGSVAAYHGLKRRLLGMTERPIDAGAPVSDGGWGEGVPLWAGGYFDNEILSGNAATAVALMTAAGLDEAPIRRAFAAFAPLPHRMAPVAEIDGVRYVDDSKATSLAALAAGVRMAASSAHAGADGTRPGILLIAGGLPKGDDPRSVLSALTGRVRKVYLIGQCAGMFRKAWEGAVACEECETLDRAVGACRREAAGGETVLLSPGAASYDQFASYGERGDAFAALVKKERRET